MFIMGHHTRAESAAVSTNRNGSKVLGDRCCLVESDSLQPQGLQHAWPPCPSPSPRTDIIYTEHSITSQYVHLQNLLLLRAEKL